MDDRHRIIPEDVRSAIDVIQDKVDFRLKEKGCGSYIGPHETYGIIAEEVYELLQALQSNSASMFRKELIDIAVGCVIGIASQLPSDTSAGVVS